MIHKSKRGSVFALLCMVLACFLSSPAFSAGNSSFYPSLSRDSQTQRLEEALNQAQIKGKPLLLILGANWCHDSRALAGYFDSPEVKQAASHYQVLPVNVGYLENLSALLGQFNYPAYFATPTVLAIDPVSKAVLNRASLVTWQSAHNESAAALAEYLDSIVSGSAVGETHSEIPPSLIEFETQQANVLYAHYQHLGALLKQEDEGKATPTLNAKWREVKAFRVKLQNDLIDLHQQPELPGAFPTDPEISWK
ncbi:MAG: thioredoxin family protein [Pseudomonadota bacterium]|nr:thioredoxin family protein [Pseudomonadota bacterium]